MLKTVAEIIDAFGGTAAFADFRGVSRFTVNTWRRRNRLPPEGDFTLVKEAKKRKIKLSHEDLARIRHEDA
ncbi:hypothetical protein [Pseudooceanicola nitratireducens]|uniref:hypothetical protein n=1 Tax=Pseudooceanicola nitratireducens TaxID=517719 RepID=UPI003C7A5450